MPSRRYRLLRLPRSRWYYTVYGPLTVTQWREGFDRYDDLLQSYATLISQGGTISPEEIISSPVIPDEVTDYDAKLEQRREARGRKKRIWKQVIGKAGFHTEFHRVSKHGYALAQIDGAMWSLWCTRTEEQQLMPSSKQQPLTAPRGRSEHDFAQTYAHWEAAVFDNAAYFATIEMRSTPRYKRIEWRYFPWAVRYARQNEAGGPCIYAVAHTERFTLLDPEKWDEWCTRWFENRSIGSPARAPAPSAQGLSGTVSASLPLPPYSGAGCRVPRLIRRSIT
jgi:hypothetical protein